ncbi:MAG: AAA family ATPase [Candidatus Acidiferrales bacterium]
MIRVITIDREYGSGGPDIAARLAERLGWKLWDQLLTNEIARQMDCDSHAVEEREERRDSFQYRLFKSFMRGSFEGTLNAPRLKMVDAECIRQVAQQVVTQAAKEGNSVIVGRGSAYYLRDSSDAFHVFIYAPLAEKVRRMKKMGKSEDEAVHLAETVDRDRTAYIKHYFGHEWPNRSLFHLMINSAMGDEAVVNAILQGIQVYEKQPVASASKHA